MLPVHYVGCICAAYALYTHSGLPPITARKCSGAVHGNGIQRNTDACDTSDTTLSFTRRPRSTRPVTFRVDASFPAASGVLCYSLPNLWVSLRLWHTLSP